MPARIDHNAHLEQVHRNLGRHYADTARNIEHLSSGLRIERSSDDPASLSLADSLSAEIRAFAEGNRNTQQGIGMLQVADGALGQVSEIVQRLQNLAVEAATSTYKDEDRRSIDAEFQALKAEIDRIAGATTYNGVPVLAAQRQFTVQFGPSAVSSNDFAILEFNDMRAEGPHLGMAALNTRTIRGATEAIAQLRVVEQKVIGERNRLGAFQNRLEKDSDTSTTAIERMREAESAVRDLDVARSVADMTRSQILAQAASSFAAEAGTQIGRVLSLLQ